MTGLKLMHSYFLLLNDYLRLRNLVSHLDVVLVEYFVKEILLMTEDFGQFHLTLLQNMFERNYKYFCNHSILYLSSTKMMVWLWCHEHSLTSLATNRSASSFKMYIKKLIVKSQYYHCICHKNLCIFSFLFPKWSERKRGVKAFLKIFSLRGKKAKKCHLIHKFNLIYLEYSKLVAIRKWNSQKIAAALKE